MPRTPATPFSVSMWKVSALMSLCTLVQRLPRKSLALKALPGSTWPSDMRVLSPRRMTEPEGMLISARAPGWVTTVSPWCRESPSASGPAGPPEASVTVTMPSTSVACMGASSVGAESSAATSSAIISFLPQSEHGSTRSGEMAASAAMCAPPGHRTGGASSSARVR